MWDWAWFGVSTLGWVVSCYIWYHNGKLEGWHEGHNDGYADGYAAGRNAGIDEVNDALHQAAVGRVEAARREWQEITAPRIYECQPGDEDGTQHARDE